MRQYRSVVFATLIFSFCLYVTNGLQAQLLDGAEAQAYSNHATKVWLDEETGALKYIELDENHRPPASSRIEWLSTLLRLRAEDELRLIKEETDVLGYTHYRYAQYYKGIPVEWGRYYVHTKEGQIVSANGEWYGTVDIAEVEVEEREALLDAALVHMSAKEFLWDMMAYEDVSVACPEAELVVVPASLYSNCPKTGALAYKYDIYATQPLSRKDIYVDVVSGKVLLALDKMHGIDTVGVAETKYNGTQAITTQTTAGGYKLKEDGRGGGVETRDMNHATGIGSGVASSTDIIDADNFWTSDSGVYDAHFGAEQAYDFYWNRFGWDSYDGNGAPLRMFVHYGSNSLAAFWDSDKAIFGDGSNGQRPLTPLVIVAHEMTHGVVDWTANLVYSGESGALDESFSDIFGVAVDFTVHPTEANYVIGDLIDEPLADLFRRDMSDPKTFDDPDTYLGDFWVSNGSASSEAHSNNGPQNYWFYLLAEGGLGVNDNGLLYGVQAIGIEKAADIAWRNLSVYLTPNTTYADARFYGIQAARDLYGGCSEELVNTVNAWAAVGVGASFDSSVVASFIAPNVEVCALPASVAFQNGSLNATSYFWDFGDGTTSTQVNPTHTYTVDGVYTVSLIATGGASCRSVDTLVLEDYITISAIGPQAAVGNCYEPASNNSFLGQLGVLGTVHFQLNTIDNASSGTLAGYEDFSCEQSTNLVVGLTYPIAVTTGSVTAENVSVWIDLNNDGNFTSTEEIFSSGPVLEHHIGSITLSASGVVYDTPLRLRVGSKAATAFSSACENPVADGQYEDYTVVVRPNSLPPIPVISVSQTTINPGQSIQFSDNSLNFPTTWAWNFPGGVVANDSAQNPLVTYPASGVYTVSLKVCNDFGCDSLTQLAYINVIDCIGGLTTPCVMQTENHCCEMGIFRVALNTLDNVSASGSEGYKDFTCLAGTFLNPNTIYTLTVETGTSVDENVTAWIDYNNDGVFTGAEEIMRTVGKVHTSTFTAPANSLVDIPLRMRIASDYSVFAAPEACQDVSFGQVEDYTVTVLSEACGRDIFEPNNAFAAAQDFPLIGSLNSAYICPIGDEDWYRFTVDASRPHVRIRLSNLPANYDVELYDNQVGLISATSDTTNGDEVIIQNNMMTGTYYIRVIGIDGAFNATDPYNLRIQKRNMPYTGNLKEVDKALAQKPPFICFPNPTADESIIHCEVNSGELVSLKVYSTVGQLVWEEKATSDVGEYVKRISVEGWDQGLYYIVLRTGKHQYVEKLIVE